jgi:uncharacterized protein (DUF3084 family)
MMKLYEISDELLKLADTDDDSIDVQAELAALGMLFADKARNIASLIKNLSAEQNALNDEANRLNAKSKAIDNRIEQIKSYLQSEMIRTEQNSIRAGIFKIRLQNSPQSLIVRDVELIPNEWKQEIHEWKIDRLGILRHLRETGEIVGGVDVKQNKHVRIY